VETSDDNIAQTRKHARKAKMATPGKLARLVLDENDLLVALTDWLESLDTDDSADQTAAIESTLEALRTDQARTVDALVDLEMRLDCDEAAARAGKARMVEHWDRRIKSIAGQRKALADAILRLTQQGLLPDQIHGQLHKISITTAREVEVVDLNALPEDCLRVNPEPNKLEIRKRLSAGEEVPGARWGERKVVKFGHITQRDRRNQSLS
jgi:hypothetical protein